MRKAVRAFSGALLVLATVTACDDDPLSEGRDAASYFVVNPAVAVVNAGDSTRITAIVMNQHGAPIGAAVTAEPCDGKVSAAADPLRSPFEEPERFVVKGVTLGESCLVVRGGGLTDTAVIRVVPADLVITGADTLGSGLTAQLAVQFRNAAGAVVTGFTAANYTWTSLNPTNAVVSSTGEISAQAPGTARIVATTLSNTGAVRADTLQVVVRAGPFSGTVTQGAIGATGSTTQALTFTQGAIAFDSDTQVRLLSGSTVVKTWLVPGTPANIRQLAVPYGLSGTYTYEVTNIGPNQVASVGTVTINTPAVDAFGPDEAASQTTRVATPGQLIFGTLDGEDLDDWIKLTITEAGSYAFNVDWTDASDVDLLLRNPTNTGYTSTSMATGAKPEVATVTLQPGSYWIWMNMYEWAPAGTSATTYRVSVTKQ